MLDIKITRTTSPKEKPDENNLGFGKKFTDHMFVMDYTEGEGWHVFSEGGCRGDTGCTL